MFMTQSSNHSANSLSLVYLDANATTQVLPEAASAAVSTMETLFGNPSSSHVTGIQAKQIMDKARNQASQIVGAGGGSIIFTSGATEGIQTAILSALYHAKKQMVEGLNYSLLYGATEHKAVPESLKHWNEVLGLNAQVKAIPVDELGNLDLGFIAKEAKQALMICTMAVNNETGVYQDIALLDKTIRRYNPNVAWMVDCVQALGKLALDLKNTTVDYAPFSGHKLYAPKGVGFLYVRENAPFTPFIAGGGQESGLRSGTENIPGMAALSAVLDILLGESERKFASSKELEGYRMQLVAALKQAFPEVVFNHSFENSVATTINFAIPGFSSKEIMDLFDAANIRVSSGSACSSKVTRSFVLDAMGVASWRSESAIRMSFGPAATADEITLACERIASTAGALGQSCLLNTVADIEEKAPLEGLIQFKVGGSCSWLYVDKESKEAVFIDPLEGVADRLVGIVNCQGLKLKGVIDTHGHADHESCRSSIVAKLLPEQQSDYLGWPSDAISTTLDGKTYAAISVGNKQLVKVPTPGHTEDSISLVLVNPANNDIHYAFCGDMILMDSLGRTNFCTSSASDMYNSLQLFHEIVGDNSLLCPSHDYNNEFTTTIGVEKSRNQLLKKVIDNEIDAEQFVKDKALLDSHLQDVAGSEIICGALINECQKSKVKEYDSAELAAVTAIEDSIKLIDIREPHEYALQHDEKFDANVPLTRLTQFIQDNLHSKDDPFVLVCRSGTRSHVAAQALERLGFGNVGHLKGGYALHQY